MRWIICLSVTLLAAGWGHSEDKPRKLEPRCLAIEPIALRSSVSRAIPGSRFTAIVPSREEEVCIAHLTAEEFEQAGYTWKEYQGESEDAAARLLKTINSVVDRDSDGKAIKATLRSESHLTASVVLCKDFYARFSRIFGEYVVVLIPDHFTVYVFPRGSPDFQEFGVRVLEEYNKAVWPSSREAFEVGPTGIRCIGAFDDGSGYDPGDPVEASSMVPIEPAWGLLPKSYRPMSSLSPNRGTKTPRDATKGSGGGSMSPPQAPTDPPGAVPVPSPGRLVVPVFPFDIQPGTENSGVPVRKRR